MNQKGAASAAVVTAVIALVLGAGAGYMIGNTGGEKAKEQAQTATTNTKAADLRALLNNLESEHVDLAAAATRGEKHRGH